MYQKKNLLIQKLVVIICQELLIIVEVDSDSNEYSICLEI